MISKNAHVANITPMIIIMTPATLAPALCCVNIPKLLMNPLQQTTPTTFSITH